MPKEITIFISSTCYDLVDLRSVLVSELQKAKYRVIASDIASTNFTLLPNQNSVEVCLSNVSTSDVVLLVLDRRYGPEIPGHRGMSATHLEYEKAVGCGIPVLTFVRAPFAKDHRTWRQMVHDGVPTEVIAKAVVHVDTTRHNTVYEFEQLFRMYDDLRRVTEPKKPNWIEEFDTAKDLIDIALRRVQELVRSKTFETRRLIRVWTEANSSLLATRALVSDAIKHVSELNLNRNELAVLADAAMKHGFEVVPLLFLLDRKDRDKFICDRIDTLMAENRTAALEACGSPAVVDALRNWANRHPGPDCYLRAWRASRGQVGMAETAARAAMHSILLSFFPVNYLGFEEAAMELHSNKLDALKILAEVGDRSDCAVIVRCLAFRGIPHFRGDPEHVQISDPPATIDCETLSDQLAQSALETLCRLHGRRVCFAAPITAEVIHRLRTPSLRINLLRAVIHCCPMKLAGLFPLVEGLIRNHRGEQLLSRLFEELSLAAVSLEGLLLRLSEEPPLRGTCLNGLIWHATPRSVQALISALSSWPLDLLEQTAWVLRFLIDDAREAISDAARGRLSKLVSDRQTCDLAMRVMKNLGAEGLLDLVKIIKDNGKPDEYIQRRVADTREGIYSTEKARLAGLRRKARSTVVSSYTQEAFEAESRLSNEDFDVLNSLYSSADPGGCPGLSQGD